MLSFQTSSPQVLLANIHKMINSNHITTWSYDSQGDFTHTPQQWKHKAWLRPSVVNSELRFSIVCPRGGKLSREIYAVYHGRFAEMMLAHFDESFSGGLCTALPAGGDIIRAAA